MASESPKKKRITLQTIVEKLVERADTQDYAVLSSKQGEEPMFSPKPAVPVRPYLLPLTPSSGPASPAVSEEGLDEEGQSENRGPVMQDEREETRKEGICREPMRCEVCGLRVFKSYRYISRTNAPLHLKNFVSSNVDRVRVCKRCFSSRERCRQNLALILLRSKTSQMMHLRTPLGVTYSRATKAMDHIAHDLRKSFKRPYDDLLCDETMADEEEMEVDNERFLLNGEVETSGPTKPKVFVTENKGTQEGITGASASQFKDIGLVTVVRHQNGGYCSKSNCFTQYGDISDAKFDIKTIGHQNGNGPQIDATENLRKLVDHTSVVAPTVSKNATSEINSINNKLTLLDHPYALQLPNESTSLLVKSPSAIKPVKQPDIKIGKVPSTVRPEQIKKSINQDGKMTSERTCGIICCLCDQLVTKSYSCYKKENAPEKIKHLFTPAMKVVKVCRRCLPYKKPKDDENTDSAAKSKSKMKVIKGKLVKIHSAKLVKNAKTSGKVKPVSVSEKIKVSSSEKSAQKLPSKEEPKKKKDDKSKTIPAKKMCSTVTQTLKTPGCKGEVAKEIKVGSSKCLQTDKSNPIAKESGNGKTNCPKGNNKVTCTPPKMDGVGVEEAVKIGTEVEKTVISTAKKENPMDSNHKSTTKVDSGTQSLKSMIGVRSKGKPSNTTMTSENGANNQPFNKDKKDRIPSNEENKVNIEIDSQKQVVLQDTDELQRNNESEFPDKTSQEGNNVHTKGENNIEKTEVEFESKVINMEGQAKQTAKDQTKESKDNQEGILNTRERRSTSKSPVRAKETKPAEVLSPRRAKTPGTPDKRREEKQIMPTIMTRKRMASFCESESDKKVDGESSNDNLPAPKRRAVVALLEKMSRKTVALSTTQKDSSGDQGQEGSKTGERLTDKKVGGHCMTRRNQAPVLCAKCSEQVVKSYRCILRAQSPAHIKPLFAKQKGDMLRVCRKCVKKPLTVQDTS